MRPCHHKMLHGLGLPSISQCPFHRDLFLGLRPPGETARASNKRNRSRLSHCQILSRCIRSTLCHPFACRAWIRSQFQVSISAHRSSAPEAATSSTSSRRLAVACRSKAVAVASSSMTLVVRVMSRCISTSRMFYTDDIFQFDFADVL